MTEKSTLRNIRPTSITSKNHHSSEFKRSVAIVIGINDYSCGIPPLRTARPDAKRLAAILAEDHGYEVDLLLDNVSRKRLTAMLEELSRRIEAAGILTP